MLEVERRTFAERAEPATFFIRSLAEAILKIRVVVLSILAVIGLGSLPAVAQQISAVKTPGWNIGAFAVGGSGAAEKDDIRMLGAGARFGRVFLGERGDGPLRGTLEWNAEVLPVYPFSHNGKWTYTAAVNPLVLKWNFTAATKVTPFFEVMGGTLFHAHDFPQADTARINFNTGAGVGFHIFTRHNRSVSFNLRALHISNASIGNHNPGVNASVQGSVGFTWWKR